MNAHQHRHDETLVAEVMAFTGARTKREAVDLSLRRVLDLKQQAEDILSLRGTVQWEGDLETMRLDD
jgi:Arc/MetJ family transcription regulator